MNTLENNPFQELYVTDNPNPGAFVKLFSDIPARHAQPLFKEGNVILKGTQGSGKSMLLNLLRPKIRLAYHQAGLPFPIPVEDRPFISAGINLTRSGALDIGQRTLDGRDDPGAYPLYFADFLNYYIVRDILESVKVVSANPSAFGELVDPRQMDSFAHRLSNEGCWFDALRNCETFESLCFALDKRIASYRSFHAANSDLSEAIHRTKTIIGEPIACAAQMLRDSKIIAPETAVFVRIDQLERLRTSDVISVGIGTNYRRMINKALSTRDGRLSYKIGTRRYAWEDDLYIYGAGDTLEQLRDYRVIDIDTMCRREEDRKTWIFPSFAEDAFSRRLHRAGFPDDHGRTKGYMEQLFGTSPSPADVAIKYVKSIPDRILRFDAEWDNKWKEFLRRLHSEDPLEAGLAAAWSRQKLADAKLLRDPDVSFRIRSQRPWNKPTWKKERVRQCLMQIMSRAPHRLNWSGEEQILALSAGNISIFLSICNSVWESYYRNERSRPKTEHVNSVLERGSIDQVIQGVGIHSASSLWRTKIAEQSKGDDRLRFSDMLGAKFRSWLIDDIAMSHPGHNGFSITDEELKRYPGLRTFLNAAVGFGDLYDAPHTTKLKDKKIRTKWYLNPVLSPYYQIPEAHAKEPYYATAGEVLLWLSECNVRISDAPQPPLRKNVKRRKMTVSNSDETEMQLFSQPSLKRKVERKNV